MTKDWKKKIDEEEKAREAEVEKSKKEFLESARRERVVKVQELGRKFKCHISDKPAREPMRESIELRMGLDTYHEDGDNWSKPKDLYQCVNCRNWTCAEHIYKGICQRCAEKM